MTPRELERIIAAALTCDAAGLVPEHIAKVLEEMAQQAFLYGRVTIEIKDAT